MSDGAKIPPRLFRFCDSNGLKTLVDGTLKVTPPREFNDPFEFSPGIDPDLATTIPQGAALTTSLTAPHHLLRYLFREKHPNKGEQDYRAWIEMSVSKQPPESWLERIKLARRAFVKRISESHGVACFSALSEDELKRPEIVRHWANYADDHRGLAIEFDGTHSFFVPWSKENAFHVAYTSDRPFFGFSDLEDFNDDGLVEKLRRWAKVKSEKAWGQEQEWRLIVPLAVPIAGMPIRHIADGKRILHLFQLWKPDAPEEEKQSAGKVIRRVILGSRASPELTASVRMAQSQTHLRHVEIARATESLSHFGMELVPVF